MNRTYSALALSALATGAVVLTTTEASAMPKELEATSTSQNVPAPPPEWPDEGTGYPGSEANSPEYNYPNYDKRYEVPRVQTATVSKASDDNGVEVVQAGASAVGGAAVAFGAMWLYRRRHVPAT
ncbi:hypothetical protein EV646_111228 [Kribbella antiqua]|uniref:MYXO-CTERM domain-containing protein n=1 Tax=Kribbella antiqua TaxID=2512217 RepID=A0A4R2IIK3_9ACTN|nr:hypothetical protein [Kribbella antiqua]TCO44036.1 hypothetical protein EV646_111228 [Kribbella antiqua]